MKYNSLEWLGMVLAVISVILLVVDALVDEGMFDDVYNASQIFLWGGILIWALGNMRRKNEEKDNV